MKDQVILTAGQVSEMFPIHFKSFYNSLMNGQVRKAKARGGALKLVLSFKAKQDLAQKNSSWPPLPTSDSTQLAS